MLCSSIQSNELNLCLNKLGDKLQQLKYMTLDLSPTFKKVTNINFPSAYHIADKFHMIRHAIDAFKNVRNRYKQEVLKGQREQLKIHNKNYKESKDKKLIVPKIKINQKKSATKYQTEKH